MWQVLTGFHDDDDQHKIQTLAADRTKIVSLGFYGYVISDSNKMGMYMQLLTESQNLYPLSDKTCYRTVSRSIEATGLAQI